MLFRALFHTDKDLPGLREDSPKTFQRFEEGPQKNLKPLEGSFSPHRPSRFEGGPSKNLKPAGRSLLQQTFQV
jgi:hypothetical protein